VYSKCLADDTLQPALICLFAREGELWRLRIDQSPCSSASKVLRAPGGTASVRLPADARQGQWFYYSGAASSLLGAADMSFTLMPTQIGSAPTCMT